MSKTNKVNQPEKKASTNICFEKPSKENAYHAEQLYLTGYDIEELAKHSSYTDIIFLLFKGELPASSEDRCLLDTLLILFSLPSPRHPASQAAMNSGICKTNAEHILPISLMALGGDQLGAIEVNHCYEFITQNINKPAKDVANNIIDKWQDKKQHVAPGFGQHFGDIDPLSQRFFVQLFSLKENAKTFKWISELLDELKPHQVGILDVGLAACIFHELSFGARECIGLYQLLRAPGLLAYGMEQTHKPVSAIPLLEDSQYELIKS